jgi:hypothetical protein
MDLYRPKQQNLLCDTFFCPLIILLNKYRAEYPCENLHRLTARTSEIELLFTPTKKHLVRRTALHKASQMEGWENAQTGFELLSS